MEVELPQHLAFYVLNYLPEHHLPWARALSREAQSTFATKTRIPLRAPGIAPWVVKHAYTNVFHSPKEHRRLLECRASVGDIKAVQWLRENGCEWSSSAATSAAAGGHLNMLQWLAAQSPPCPINAGACLEAASTAGHLDVLAWLLSQRSCSYFDIGVCAEAAAANGHLNILKLLAEQYPACAFDAGVCAEAAAAGQLEVLQWLKSRDCPASLSVCTIAAAAAGHVHILEWLAQEHPGCLHADCLPTVAAAATGQLHVLRILHGLSPPCPWSTTTATAAAKGGQLQVLRWLKEQSCPMDVAGCIEAANKHGHADVLQFLMTECVW